MTTTGLVRDLDTIIARAWQKLARSLGEVRTETATALLGEMSLHEQADAELNAIRRIRAAAEPVPANRHADSLMPELTHAEAATRLDPTYPDAAVSYVEALGNVCASQAPDVRLYLPQLLSHGRRGWSSLFSMLTPQRIAYVPVDKRGDPTGNPVTNRVGHRVYDNTQDIPQPKWKEPLRIPLAQYIDGKLYLATAVRPEHPRFRPEVFDPKTETWRLRARTRVAGWGRERILLPRWPSALLQFRSHPLYAELADGTVTLLHQIQYGNQRSGGGVPHGVGVAPTASGLSAHERRVFCSTCWTRAPTGRTSPLRHMLRLAAEGQVAVRCHRRDRSGWPAVLSRLRRPV